MKTKGALTIHKVRLTAKTTAGRKAQLARALQEPKMKRDRLEEKVRRECASWPMLKFVQIEPRIVKLLRHEAAYQRAQVRRIVQGKLNNVPTAVRPTQGTVAWQEGYEVACNDILATLTKDRG